MNAVEHMLDLLGPVAVRRLASLRVPRIAQASWLAPPSSRVLDNDEARAHVLARWGGDLCGLLNALTRGELAALAERLAARGRSPLGDACAPPPGVRAPELREAVWDAGARLERNDTEADAALQPRPVVLGGHLVVQAPPRGAYPPAPRWPRPVPPAAPPAPPPEEPDTLDELLAAADRALGVRLGRRGSDKGAWGLRAAALLGVVERGLDEPDWRGDVEVKTVPIARDPTGRWRVAEDPAIAMVGSFSSSSLAALAKLQRTLWLARADTGDGDATIVSWYLLEWDGEVARLARRYLHERPKGPAGTDQRGLYLHKRFFADAGLLATLNGPC